MSADERSIGRRAEVYQQGQLAGYLEEEGDDSWRFSYLPNYVGLAVSLTMPKQTQPYLFKTFPPLFDGLLPEGLQLEALLRIHKLDRYDLFGQLMIVGEDLVGSLSVRPAKESSEEEAGHHD
ncbi:MAG: HipA N-terminal domain-containing protein [Verrucomicrobiota bacterium]